MALPTAVFLGRGRGRTTISIMAPVSYTHLDVYKRQAYADAYFVNANSREKPGVVDRRRIPITDPLMVYSGCYVRALSLIHISSERAYLQH